MTCKIAVEMNPGQGITELLKLRGNADLYVREFLQSARRGPRMRLATRPT